ncbi:MAG: asparagine synthase-related protein [Alphaproteobacteria bacterium]
MSAIGAIYFRDKRPPDMRVLQRMASAMTVHGSERQKVGVIGPIGFVWCHSGGYTPEDIFENQPVDLGAGQVAGVFAGELHHRAELAVLAGISASDLKTMPDSVLFLRAFQTIGWDRLSATVSGNFSAIVFDKQTQRLTALLSPMNGQPLVYHENAERLAIASTPSGLFAIGDIERRLDEEKIADGLILNQRNAMQTHFQNIRRVPAAHILQSDGGTPTIRRYCTFEDSPDIHLPSDDAYVERAHELLDRAVRDAMRAPRTPSSMLSGGLDSSAVSLAAAPYAAEKGERLLCLTSVPEAGWDGVIPKRRYGDEGPRAAELAHMYPDLIDHRQIASEGMGIYDFADQMNHLNEAPIRNFSNMFWIHALLRASAAEGRRVMLDGMVGNLSLTYDGMQYGAELLSKGRLVALAKHSWRLRGVGRFGVASALWHFTLPAFMPRPVYRYFIKRSGNIEDDWQNYSLANPDYLDSLNTFERAADHGHDPNYRPPKTARQMRALVLAPEGLAEMPAIHLAMESLHGVRFRGPLGDRQLMEWCAGVPTEQFFLRGEQRSLIRRMMRDKLPPAYFDYKRGLQAADWHLRMTRDLPRMKADLASIIDDPDMAARFDIKKLQLLLDNWPDNTPPIRKGDNHYWLLQLGVSRALGTAQFIRWVEGKNR